MNTALMLSGLPPDKLSQLTKTIKKVQSCFKDLCVYLFICVVSHQVLNMSLT